MRRTVSRAQNRRRGAPGRPPEIAPLSHQQRQLWLVERSAVAGSLYNEHFALRIRGSLDVGALEEALATVVARHDALRTVFPLVGDEPVQRVLPEVDVSLRPVADFTSLPVEHPFQAALAYVREVAEQPYDLARGPLLRAVLARVAPDDHVLAVAMHHIVVDGMSLAVLTSELSLAYGDLSRGLEPALGPVEAQYADFARWQAAAVANGTLDRAVAYWRRHLAGVDPILDLPTDRPRPRTRSERGRARLHRLDRQLAERVDELARATGCTPFTVLLAAFGALLYRYTGANDLVLGTGSHGRPRGFSRTVGLFANILPLRLRPRGDLRFDEFVGAVAETAFDALDHQHVPFEMLVQIVSPPRDPAYTPLVQVMFTAWNEPAPGLAMGELEASFVELHRDRARFDLVVQAAVGRDAVELFLEYDTDLFDDATIDRLIAHYSRLLDAGCRAPEEPISALPVLTADEEHRLVADGRGETDRNGNRAPPLVVGRLTVSGRPTDPLAMRTSDGAMEVLGGPQRAGERPVAPDAVPRRADAAPRERSEAVRAVESTIARVWAQSMDVDAVGPDDDFFELGGHSMLAARVAERLATLLAVPVRLATIFEFPTVGELADELLRLHPELADESADRGPSAAAGVLNDERRQRAAPAAQQIPLSAAQLQIWVAEQLARADGLELEDFVAVAAYRIEGPLDVVALERAFNALVERHPLLRASVHDGDEPVLRIADDVALEIAVDDAATEDAAAYASAEARAIAQAKRPFDLGVPPLHRVGVARARPDLATLVLVQHHLVTDGLSMRTLMHELGELYAADVGGRRPRLAPPGSATYGDYVRWERAWFGTDEAAAAAAFWKRRLAGVPKLELPVSGDRSRRTLASAHCEIRVARETARAAVAFARACRTSPFAVTTAAFAAALADWAQQDVFTIGSVVDGRPSEAFDPVIGCFANLVAIPIDVREDPSFRALVRRIASDVVDVFAHRALPFHRVVRELGVARTDPLPLFSVTAEWLAYEQIGLELPGCVIRPELVRRGSSRYDLALFAAPDAGWLALEAEFAPELFRPAEVRRRLELAASTLERGTRAPDTRLSALLAG